MMSAHSLLLTLIFCALQLAPLSGQKMLILERANRAKTQRFYPGDGLHYRLQGQEDYWYRRQITDILPDQQSLLLDNFTVRLGDIHSLKVRRAPAMQIGGGALLSFGVSLAFASTVAVLFGEREYNYAALYGSSALSFGVGYLMASKKKVRIDERRYRLRLVEIRFPDKN